MASIWIFDFNSLKPKKNINLGLTHQQILKLNTLIILRPIYKVHLFNLILFFHSTLFAFGLVVNSQQLNGIDFKINASNINLYLSI